MAPLEYTCLHKSTHINIIKIIAAVPDLAVHAFNLSICETVSGREFKAKLVH